MKIVTLTILSVFLAFNSFAQDKSIAKVHYQFKHVNDTIQPDKYLSDEVVTYLGTSSSYYTSYSSTRVSEQIATQMASPTFDGNIIVTGTGTAIKETYLIDILTPKLDVIKSVGTARFVLSVKFPEQDWQIEEETKIIGGYNCQKATTSFKGRNYVAWFCPDIPMPYGPWKLHGLPGLILAANDDKNEVVFEYAGFDRLDAENSLVIAVSPDAKKSTEQEVLVLEKAFKENPSAFIKAQQAGRAGSALGVSSAYSTSGAVYSPRPSGGTNGSDVNKIKSMTVNKDVSYKPSNVTNNPIELTN